MFKKTVLYNDYLGMYESNLFFQNEESELSEYIMFRKKKFHLMPSKLVFKNEVLLNFKFKCIDTFSYRHSKFLNFDIVKIKIYGTNETKYLQFIQYKHSIYQKKTINEDKNLKLLYKNSEDMETQKESKYGIYKFEIKDCEELYVEHYKQYRSKNDFFKIEDINDTLKELNHVEKGDVVVFRTVFPMTNFKQSTVNDNFKDFRFMSIINDFDPAGSYELKNQKVLQSEYNPDIFYVFDNEVRNLFKNKIPESYIEKNSIVFDIESECVSHRTIEDEKNIITHIGFEYFSDKYYEDFKNHTESFNSCLINLDFHIRLELLKKNLIAVDENKDFVYEEIMNKTYTKDRKKHCETEIKLLLENQEIVHVYNGGKISELCKKFKYIFCTEKEMLDLFLKLKYEMKYVDFIGTFNGNSFDYPAISCRRAYLNNTTISKELELDFLYGTKKNRYFKSENKKTGFSITNMLFGLQYFNVDVFNYCSKERPNFNSFNLKDISKGEYNLDLILRPIVNTENFEVLFPKYIQKNDKKKQVEYEKKLFNFIQVLLTTSYSYMNDKVFKIVDKSKFLNNNQNIYSVDIKKIIEKTKERFGVTLLEASYIITPTEKINILKDFDWKFYERNIYNISLSKDDVEISNHDIFMKTSSLDIANYCLHDALLCRYLIYSMMIFEDINVCATLNLLPQQESFIYRNSTNSTSDILDTFVREKKIILKTQRIHSNKISGGVVFNPREKFPKEPVLIFDFESLYPSIMAKYNISPDTLKMVIVLSCEIEFHIVKKEIEDKVNQKKFTVISVNDGKNFCILIFTKIYSDGSDRKGFLGIISERLKKKRKEYKKLMNEFYKEGNILLYDINNMLQNRIKIKANSFYGFLATDFHNLSCKFTSQAVTLVGYNSTSFLAKYLDGAIIKNNELKITSTETYNNIISEKIECKKSYEFIIPFENEMQLKLIYGDTDSVMLSIKNVNNINNIEKNNNDKYKKQMVYVCSLIGNLLNNLINEEILKKYLNLEFEAICLNMFLFNKKKYTLQKHEPILNTDKYTLETSEEINLDIKKDNKGTSLKRRGNCSLQKKNISEYLEYLQKKVDEVKFSEITLDIDIILQETFKFLVYKRNEMVIDFMKNNYLHNDYTISNSYKGFYKLEDNITKKMITEYNKTSKEQIKKGERFLFVFKTEFNPEKLTEYINNNEELEFSKILKYIGWDRIGKIKEVLKHRCVYDNILNLDWKSGNRICLEIYFNSLLNDVCTFFDEDFKTRLVYSINKEEKKLLGSVN